MCAWCIDGEQVCLHDLKLMAALKQKPAAGNKPLYWARPQLHLRIENKEDNVSQDVLLTTNGAEIRNRKLCRVEGCTASLARDNTTGYCGDHWRTVGQPEQARARKKLHGNKDRSKPEKPRVASQATINNQHESHEDKNGTGKSAALIAADQVVVEERMNAVILNLPMNDKLRILNSYLTGQI